MDGLGRWSVHRLRLGWPMIYLLLAIVCTVLMTVAHEFSNRFKRQDRPMLAMASCVLSWVALCAVGVITVAFLVAIWRVSSGG